MFKKIIFLLFFSGFVMNIAACSPFVVWKEEVKLNDGRVIVVEQKKRMEGQIAREAWMTINLPEISPNAIVWHENLSPLIVNINDGRLYVVGYPPTGREQSQYGSPSPYYIGFRWDSGIFVRIPFDQIPEKIYSTNMLIDGFPPNHESFVRIQTKDDLRKAIPPYPLDFQRLNPNVGCFC